MAEFKKGWTGGKVGLTEHTGSRVDLIRIFDVPRIETKELLCYTVIPRFYPLSILSKFDFIHFSFFEFFNK